MGSTGMLTVIAFPAPPGPGKKGALADALGFGYEHALTVSHGFASCSVALNEPM
jgi:hypothetical protein